MTDSKFHSPAIRKWWPIRACSAFVASSSLVACLVHAAPPDPQTLDRLVETQNYAAAIEGMLQAKSLDEFLQLPDAEENVQGVSAAMREQAEQMQRQLQKMLKTLPPEAVAEFEALMLRMIKTVMQDVRWEAVKPVMLQVYGQLFTQEEAQALLELYSTPTGRSAAQKLLSAGQIVQAVRGDAPSAKVQAELDQVYKELAALEQKYPQVNQRIPKQ